MNKALLIGVAAFLALVLIGCSEKPIEQVKPEIHQITPSGVTVSWSSAKPYKGQVFYKPSGTQTRALSAAEKTSDGRDHEIKISGLKPGTYYTYWMAEKGKRFRFKTQPPVNTPFSFLMFSGDGSGRLEQLMKSEVPDFLLSLNPRPEESGGLSDIKAFLPVFQLNRIRNLDWAGLRLIVLRGSSELEKLPLLLSTEAPHTFGIIADAGLTGAAIVSSVLHTSLLAHNKQHPASPASFVFVLGTDKSNMDKLDDMEIDGIRYLGLHPGKQVTGGKLEAIRIDVDVESTRAVFIDEGKEIALRNPPLRGKRSCHECRRLADKGAYKQSIKAYTEFIENNAGHYQIDDAYFAIAELYDEKLFQFNEAMTWYRRLIDEHPSGTLTALANQRIAYLSRFSDFQFKPLQAFERIRKVDFSRKEGQPGEQLKLLEQVETLIDKYPDCKLAPVMRHWLANRYREFSIEKALASFETLREKYPDSAESAEISLEIGETYYNAGHYKEAIKIYQTALAELPGKKKTIIARINRSKRNIRRVKLAYGSWIILALLCLLTFWLKPMGLDFSAIGRGLLIFIILAILLLFAGWLIREQFPSNAQMWTFALLFPAAAALSSFFSFNLAQKTAAARRGLRIVIGGLSGIVFFLSGFYLVIYYVSVHYLTVFKL